MTGGVGLYWEEQFGFKPYLFGILTLIFFIGGVYTLITDKNYWYLGLIIILASVGLGILTVQGWKRASA